MKNKTFKNLIVIIMIVLIFANSLYVFAITNDKTQITVENFEEFKTAIKDAKDGSVIEIKGCIELTYENDTTIGYSDKRIIIKPSDEESSLKIDVTTNLIFKNIVFDGYNISIYNSFIQLYGNDTNYTTTFQNVIFQNFNIVYSAVVSMDNSTNIFNNCIFTNNKNGGHMEVKSKGVVNLNNCICINGYSSYGGTICLESNDAVCNIDSCLITNNHAETAGGGINNNGIVTIKNSKIYYNTAGLAGNDIFTDKRATLNLLDSIEDLQKLFAIDKLKPIAWIYDHDGSVYFKENGLKLQFGEYEESDENLQNKNDENNNDTEKDDTNDNKENDSSNITDNPNISENDDSKNETENSSPQNSNKSDSSSSSSNLSNSNKSTEENSFSLSENMNPNLSQTFNFSNDSSSDSSNPVTMEETDSSQQSKSVSYLTDSLSNSKTESSNPLNQSFNFTFESQNNENNNNLIIIFISIQSTLLFVIFIILITQNKQNNKNRYSQRRHKHHRKH